MTGRKGLSKGVTRFAVAAFAITTLVLLLPGYLTSWQAEPPRDAEFYVSQAFERRQRVFDESGAFGRLPADAAFGDVTMFSCARSAAARLEFGWRGARERLYDCPAVFRDQEGRAYTWVFRLIADEDAAAAAAPEGYRTLHIDAIDARVLLEQKKLL